LLIVQNILNLVFDFCKRILKRSKKLNSFTNFNKPFSIYFEKFEKEMRRVTGIEPVPSPWQGGILPLDHTRVRRVYYLQLTVIIPYCLLLN